MSEPLYGESKRAARLKATRLDSKWKVPSPPEFRRWVAESRTSCTPKISQRELATLVGCHRLTIARLEQGVIEPTLRVAHAVWRVLHAAHAGKLWVAVQVRRDNRELAIRARSDLAETQAPVKLRKLIPDDPDEPRSRAARAAARRGE